MQPMVVRLYGVVMTTTSSGLVSWPGGDHPSITAGAEGGRTTRVLGHTSATTCSNLGDYPGNVCMYDVVAMEFPLVIPPGDSVSCTVHVAR